LLHGQTSKQVVETSTKNLKTEKEDALIHGKWRRPTRTIVISVTTACLMCSIISCSDPSTPGYCGKGFQCLVI